MQAGHCDEQYERQNVRWDLAKPPSSVCAAHKGAQAADRKAGRGRAHRLGTL
jgi:hypothetical protein